MTFFTKGLIDWVLSPLDIYKRHHFWQRVSQFRIFFTAPTIFEQDVVFIMLLAAVTHKSLLWSRPNERPY